MENTTDVLIVGAGPTGLMAGLLLQQHGIKFRIIDKNAQQAHESRAFALHARSLELFQNIGIVDKFLARGVNALGMQIFVNGHKAAQININDIGASNSPYPFILMLPQAEIEQILIAELAQYNIEVEHNTELTAFTQDNNGVTATIINKEKQTQQIQASYLLGADGAHSIVRNILGLTFVGSAYSQNFMLADCNIDWPLGYDFAKVFMRGRSLGAYLPIKGTLGRIIAINPYTKNQDSAAAKLATTAEPLTLAEIEKAFQEVTGMPVKFSQPIWTTRYRIHHRGVDQYNIGRVFVAGDAAHIHSPIGGQGMNTGLQDVANLIWKLALAIKNKDCDSKKILETYNSERWPVGQKLLHFTDRLFVTLSSQSKLTATLRNFFAPLIMKIVTKIPRCKTRLFRFVSQLGIRYHANAFLSGFSKPLSAGHRAPNAQFKRNHDVFSLIAGYHFHVLALSKKALSLEEINRISADLDSLPKNIIGLPLHTHFITHSLTGQNAKIIQAELPEVFANYGLTDKNPYGLFLIRPDGYIAYRSDELNVENLKNFCALFY